MRLWALVSLLLPVAAFAHGLDPAALTLAETDPGVFDVRWRASALRLPGANVRPVLPDRCRPTSNVVAEDGGDHVTLRWTVDCGPDGLAGTVISIDDLAAAKINALLGITRLSGDQVQTVLGPHRSTFDVPAQARRADVLGGYVRLGFEHILAGPDHLLFVLGLLLLVSSRRLLVETITAFTVGHSITLSAAALGVATVPSRPVEVLIALSVLTLAVELARDVHESTWLRRYPWAMAIAFGLLHGFGFAGALAEAGLPAGQIPLALVSFNAGIELGQLAFVGVALLASLLARAVVPAMATYSTRPAVYGMGILAAYWCFERMAVWLA